MIECIDCDFPPGKVVFLVRVVHSSLGRFDVVLGWLKYTTDSKRTTLLMKIHRELP